jgi:deazaflavin-dependent oxidoreductase (nitroreductase family)
MDRSRYLIIASHGGADVHPNWYLNLMAHPDVVVQVGDELIKVHARIAGADEKPELWSIMSSRWPRYLRYQTLTDRDIPLVILEPA